MRYTYETTENASYVIANFFDGKEIDNNHLKILVTNDLKNIIKPICRENTRDICLSYNITSKISLDQATAKRRIPKNGFINIIEGALSAFDEIQKHELSASGIDFDEKSVYVKAGTYEPSFVYLPRTVQDGGIEHLKNFIISLVMESKIERMNDGFVQALFDTLNNPNLCTNDLRELCSEQTKGRMSAAKLAKDARFSVITPTMIDSESEVLGSVYKKFEPKVAMPKEALQENSLDKKEKSIPWEKSKKYIFIVIQVLAIGIMTVVLKSGFFDNADGALNIKYLLAIIGALCVADFVIYREFFISDKSADDEDDKNDLAKPSTAKEAQPIQDKKMSDLHQSPPAPSPIYNAPKSLEQIYAGEKGSEFDDTVLLEDETPCAHLEFFENGIFRKIKLDSDVVTVGKLSGQCDYAISNNKISKIHAQFIVRENEYFVKDCNSTNGTYINGNTHRIASNVEYPIGDGDRITLANVEMTLKC